MGLQNPSAFFGPGTATTKPKPNFDLGPNNSRPRSNEVPENESNNNSVIPIVGVGPTSITSDTSLPITIDLTGPLPIISVLRRDGTRGSYTDYKTTASEKLYNKLISDAVGIPVKAPIFPIVLNGIEESISCSSSSDDFSDISDINPQLLAQGRGFIRRNFFAILFAHLVAIAFILGVKPIQALLLRTGSLHRKEKSLSRYLSFCWSMKVLYDCDLIAEDDIKSKSSSASDSGSGSNSNSYESNAHSQTIAELKSIREVMGKLQKNFPIYAPPPNHIMKLETNEEKLLEALQQDLISIEGVKSDELELRDKNKIFTTRNPTVPLSQYDLVMMQFGFFGFISLFPKVFGIHESEKKFPDGLKGFIHIWAVFGKRLGIEDRFNLCLEKNFDNNLNLKIFKEVFLFSFKISDENLVKLWRSMMWGSSRYGFFFRTKALLHFMMKNVVGLSSPKNVYAIMNLYEKFIYHSYNICANWLLRLWILRGVFNLCFKITIYLGHRLYLRRLRKKSPSYENKDLIVKTVS